MLAALLADRDAFGWLDHTFQHLDLDGAPQAEIEGEIERNVAWAAGAGIALQPGVLVTGAHTGLANLSATRLARRIPHYFHQSNLIGALDSDREEAALT